MKILFKAVSFQSMAAFAKQFCLELLQIIFHLLFGQQLAHC